MCVCVCVCVRVCVIVSLETTSLSSLKRQSCSWSFDQYSRLSQDVYGHITLDSFALAIEEIYQSRRATIRTFNDRYQCVVNLLSSTICRFWLCVVRFAHFELTHSNVCFCLCVCCEWEIACSACLTTIAAVLRMSVSSYIQTHSMHLFPLHLFLMLKPCTSLGGTLRAFLRAAYIVTGILIAMLVLAT